ncbi:MAG: presqualene diphosphate synthase HpnD [Chromatiales bacterium]|jgi:phytoene synthase|nr:presqualene diphosphate synthase HpnD [Chromatiales bacterium]MDX9767787.1 presqualene diphosphate synthase HpnD [Ectothiorhodospiraceae bacterium]
MTPEQYCQQKAARSGSSFYYSFLFLPPEKRRAIMALYAFCREVDDVVDECAEPAVAARKLGWWREEIERTFRGQPTHPVGHALRGTLERFYLPQEYFLEIIDGMEMDLQYDSYPSFSELALYCHRVAGVVGLLAAEIFGHEDRQTTRYANDLGIAFQLTNILRDVGEDLRRGRVYIPLDEMERFGVSPADLGRGQTSERLRELFAFQAERARDYYRRAFEHLPEVDRYAQRSGLIMAAVYQTLLDELEAEGFRVLEGRIHLTPLRKLWIAWRTARNERGRHRRRLREARA